MPNTVVVDIPGGKAELRKKVTVGGRVAVQKVIARNYPVLKSLNVTALSKVAQAFQLSEEQIEGLFDLNRELALAYLVRWDLVDEDTGEPVPIPTGDTVGDVDPDVFDALGIEAWKLYMPQGKPSTPSVDVEDAGDPDSPTGPSDASKTASASEGGTSESTSTPTSESDGSPSSTASASPE